MDSFRVNAERVGALIGFVVLAVLLVPELLSRPPLFAVGAFCMLVAVLKPMSAIWMIVLLEGTKLYLVAHGQDATQFTTASFALLVGGSVGAAFRRGFPMAMAAYGGAFFAGMAGLGLFNELLDSPFTHFATTLYLVVAPLLAALIASTATRGEWRFAGIIFMVVLGLNAAACAWEAAAGARGFEALGFDYGTEVRQIDGILRTPGLTETNSTAGLLGAGLGFTLFAMYYLGVGLGRIATIIGVLLAGVVVVLSTSRSGGILAASALVVLFLSSRGLRKQRSGLGAQLFRLFMVGAPVALVWVFIRYGADSTQSLSERLDLWPQLMKQYASVSGLGAGRAGASSFSDSNPHLPIFADNSWLSVIVQYGYWGILVFVVGIVALVMAARSRRFRHQAEWSVVISVIVSLAITGLFIEVLDYVVCMVPMIAMVGFAMSRRDTDPEPGRSNEADTTTSTSSVPA